MSSQDEEEDVLDERFDEYSDYVSGTSSDHYVQEYDRVITEDEQDNDNEIEKDDEQNEVPISVHESISYKPHEIDFKQCARESADNEDFVKQCMTQAIKINEKITNQRKQLKEQLKEFQNAANALRNNIKDYDMPYQTAHFPLYLKTSEKFVILPSQNLNIRKGTVESFMKTNLENENSVKKAEQERRVAFKQRRPYQRRKFDS